MRCMLVVGFGQGMFAPAEVYSLPWTSFYRPSLNVVHPAETEVILPAHLAATRESQHCVSSSLSWSVLS